jgi:hypothetical protein
VSSFSETQSLRHPYVVVGPTEGDDGVTPRGCRTGAGSTHQKEMAASPEQRAPRGGEDGRPELRAARGGEGSRRSGRIQ